MRHCLFFSHSASEKPGFLLEIPNIPGLSKTVTGFNRHKTKNLLKQVFCFANYFLGGWHAFLKAHPPRASTGATGLQARHGVYAIKN